MKNKLAIFDLDGTLFDTVNVNYYSYKKALNECGFDIEYEYFKKYCNGRHYKTFITPIVNGDEEILEKIHKRKKELYQDYVGEARKNANLFKIAEALRNDCYLALVTTASRENVFQLLERFNRLDFFDLVLTQEDVTKKKPDPEGFVKAINYFSVSAENTMIFEDADVGITAALATEATVFKIENF